MESPFTGELVRLTQIQRDDLDAYKRWFRDYGVQRFLSRYPVPITDEAEEEWYERTATETETFHFSIRTIADNRLIGNCGLFDISWKNRSAMFGIVIGEQDAWGQGYGTDAIRLILRFAFGELNLNRVGLDVYAFNLRGVRAYEKAGFVHEGIIRQALFRENQYHDVHKMGILREEWQEAD